MPPKKKSAAKKKPGLARGFATVSVASKKKESDEEITPAASGSATPSNGAEGPAAEVSGPVVAPTSAKGDNATAHASLSANETASTTREEWDQETLELQELQDLADRVKPLIDKEVSRLMKVIDYERRLSKSLSTYVWTEQDLLKRIVALAKAELDSNRPLPMLEAEDRVVAKVGALYTVLQQLGFSPERAEECLRNAKTLEVDDVFDWLFLTCDAEELSCEGPILVNLDDTSASDVQASQTRNGASTPRTSIPATPAPAQNGSSTPIPAADGGVDQRALRQRLQDFESRLTEELESDETDANQTYVAIKLKLTDLQRAQGAAKRAHRGNQSLDAAALEAESLRDMQIDVLQRKLKSIEDDYTFRKVDAEQMYRAERTKLDAAQLAARLNGVDIQPSQGTNHFVKTTEPSSELKAQPSQPVDPSDKASSVNSKGPEHNSEDMGETMFGTMLDEMPQTETNDQGTTIPVRDMALPKHFSGKTPKMNLEDTVRKTDRYATISFKKISSSRAVRAAVTIRWSGGRMQTFKMQNVACHDQKQAFDYIATVALFEISTTAVNKQLPTVYRDLWDELVAEKKQQDDAAYREQLKLFRSIAEPRVQDPASRDSRVSRSVSDPPTETETMHRHHVSDEESDRIIHEFSERQNWPSYQEMLRQRASLPISAFRSMITQTIEQNQCMVLCGETGCGKSTQVPSFIVEHDMRKGRHVKVFCTEPRRISAISLAQRVSTELGEGPNACGTRNSLVGYSIRLDSAVSASTRIVYATTGIVLRMLEGANSLSDCTHIIIDEVHERSIDSDFLLIILRQLMEVRKDLKVILMSATVDAEKISAYMGGCPVVTVPGRTFPVESYFLEDILEMTGYHLDPYSDSPYVARNKRGYGNRQQRRTIDDDVPEDDDDESDREGPIALRGSLSRQTEITLDCMDHHAINFDLMLRLLEDLCFNKPSLVQYSAAVLVFLPSLESIRRLTDLLEAHRAFGSREFLILPLHSMLSNENQSLVFNVPRKGIRKIVISTNIAETGVTIPDITAVIDSGKHREMRFDEKRQISRLVETFVAQSNAKQRRGRAGRVQEGMQEHPQPEMLRLSLQDLALRIKIMKIGSSSIEDVLLQALDPPLQLNIQRAVASLVEAKALTTTEEITPLGRHLAKLPMDVHLGKFLIMSCIFSCLDAALTITAALNSKSPWVTPFGREAEADAVKRNFKIENSDFLTTYNAYTVWREACGNGYEREFCRASQPKLASISVQQNLVMIEELRQQYFSFLVDAGFIQCTEAEKRELVSTRYGKSRTRFVKVPSDLDLNSRDPKLVMACLAGSLFPKLLVVDHQTGAMKTFSNNAPAAIHPSSVNFQPGRRQDFGGAKFIAFFTAMHTKKLYVWESGGVDERAVYLLCGNADFQATHSISIDRKVKTRLDPKSTIALRVLRQKWSSFFNAKMKSPSLVIGEQQQAWLELLKEALASSDLLQDEMKKKKQESRPAMQLSMVKNTV
ncbi:hypothetical protein OIV83_000245 [Microbotryomycetes sp. JL201]|nr:hypothetical protein OIV83_000245 [Microbotryomycetes sp. JL201]